MNGHTPFELQAVAPEVFVLAGSFAPNGASTPTTTDSRGRRAMPFTVAYTATGIYTVTLPSGFNFPSQPLSIVVSSQCSAIANWFEVTVVGETTLNTTTRQFVIQAHRGGVANAPAAAAGTRINFAIVASNNTGG